MSINDPLVIATHKDRFIIMRGRETFWDENRYLITFETIEGARAWALLHLNQDVWWPQERLETQPERPKLKGEKLAIHQFTFLQQSDDGMDPFLQEDESVHDGVDGEV